MQDFPSGISESDFKKKVSRPVSKLELYHDGDAEWKNLCDLGGENYLISIDYSSGQTELTYEPVAASITVELDDTDGDLNPKNDEGSYNDYLRVGRKIRFYTGFKKNDYDHLWQWFVGFISEVSINRSNKTITIRASDYTQRLIETKLKSPDNYWGTSVTKSVVADQAEYDLPVACNGVYIAYLDGTQIYDRDTWTYDRGNNKFVFLPSEIPAAGGTDNLIIYYYTTQDVEDVVADILVAAGLYADQAAALSDMDYEATGVTIDRVRFGSGVQALYAIKKLCERVDYEFHFKYDGTPLFRSIATTKAWADRDATIEKELTSRFDYVENIDEVGNYIVVEGEEYSIYDELIRIIGGGELADNSVDTRHLVDTSVENAKIAVEAIYGDVIKAAAITEDKIANSAITNLKLADDAVTNAKIAVNEIYGDVIEAAAITETKIADDSISTAKLQASSVIAGKIGAGEVITSKLDAEAVTAEKIAADAVTSDKIYAGAVVASKIAAGAIETEKLDAAAVTAAKIASGAVTTEKIAAGAITAEKIAAGVITAGEITADWIAAGAITADKIATDAVTATKIKADAVTATKINVTSLSSINADMGTLTAGKIDVGNIEINADTERILFGSATTPTSGTGIFIGKYSKYQLRAGNPSGHMIIWDGSNLNIYKDGIHEIDAEELEEGAARARMYIDYLGVFSGQIWVGETGVKVGAGTKELKTFSAGGGNYYLGYNTGVTGGGGGTGDSCFPADTPVLMADGEFKAIKDIKAGDKVLTRESETFSKLVEARVLKLYEHNEDEADSYLLINKFFKVTPNHRILINGVWQRVENIKIGDKLIKKDGKELPVDSIRKIHNVNEKTYNLEIEKYRTYIANGIYVHNAKDPGYSA